MAKRLAPTGIDLVICHDPAFLPFYNDDLEAVDLIPGEVTRWRDAVRRCDGLFICSPEYNFGTTALLKNAIDWASRPFGQHALTGKVISLISSSGSTGGRHTIEQLSGILTLLGNSVVSDPDDQLLNGQLPKGAERISTSGTTTDPTIEKLVTHRLQAMISAKNATA